jgi:hypothetical protein
MPPGPWERARQTDKPVRDRLDAMNSALPSPMTLAEFLAWEERQELRYEFDGIRPVAMVGGTVAHSVIQANLIAALRIRLRGSPCRPSGSDPEIEVAGRIRYPDAFVVCTPVPRDRTVIHGSRDRFRNPEPRNRPDRSNRQESGIRGHAFDPALCHDRTRYGGGDRLFARGRTLVRLGPGRNGRKFWRCRKSASRSGWPNFMTNSKCRRSRLRPGKTRFGL